MGGVQTPNNGDSKQIQLKVSSTLQNVNSLKKLKKHFWKDNKDKTLNKSNQLNATPGLTWLQDNAKQERDKH